MLHIESSWSTGIRFCNTTAIPTGATIASARLLLTSSQAIASVNTRVAFEYATNPGPFAASPASALSSGRTMSPTNVVWNEPSWPINVQRQSSNLAASLQQIITNRSWVSGNALVVLIQWQQGGAQVYSVEATNAARRSSPRRIHRRLT